ncbi:unnamed protein product [Caenorhabditis auriculariae]|uniref:Gustatory receptor n=1 Tax=Caenorhabditis auriculariae TaxID=2777116 RepID=A0A8S1HUQ6_9PELO|nr:unnamed protein product [Caenorhabditis auriculariae]
MTQVQQGEFVTWVLFCFAVALAVAVVVYYKFCKSCASCWPASNRSRAFTGSLQPQEIFQMKFQTGEIVTFYMFGFTVALTATVVAYYKFLGPKIDSKSVNRFVNDVNFLKMAIEKEKATVVLHDMEDETEDFAHRIFKVATIMRINFLKKDRCTRSINFFVAGLFFILGVYSFIYATKVTFAYRFTTYEVSMTLLVLTWKVQSLISMVFLVYWQLYGHLRSFRRRLAGCQQLKGLAQGRRMIDGNTHFFFVILVFEVSICFAFAAKYHLSEFHTEYSTVLSRVFFYTELRPLYTCVTVYLYLVWNIALFVLILYTNATFLEVRYFNQQIEKFDGSDENAEEDLLAHMNTYGDLIGVIRQLDRIFRFYTFIMIVTTIPSMIFTLMMMNQRIHSFTDLLFCSPSISLCIYSFFAVTIAPARLHDEIRLTKTCFCQNKSIWFPYRREVYLIASTFASHMEQYELGVSVWGFAVLSRPLILGTLSATAMLMSLLTELAPKADLFSDHSTKHS